MHILKNDLLKYNFSTYVFRNSQEPLTVERKDLSNPSRLDLALHCHDFPQVWYCFEGNFSVLTDDRRYEVQKGSLLVVPLGIMHRIVIPDGVAPQVFRVNINYNIFREKAPVIYINTIIHLFMGAFGSEIRMNARELITLQEETAKEAFQLLTKLDASNQAESQLSVEEKLIVLERIFSLPDFAVSEQTGKHAISLWQTKINPIILGIVYVNDNFNEKILIKDMQRITFLGHSTFYETFRRFMNSSFLKYLQIIRLKNAHLMMRETDFSIAQVASMCGFNSHSHMERTYKKYSGVCSSKARAHSIEWARENPNRTK